LTIQLFGRYGRCVGIKIGEFDDSTFALSISVPVFRVDVRRLRAFVPLVRRTCERIGEAMKGQA
jgi:DNA-binding IclR family transcriptional regulator